MVFSPPKASDTDRAGLTFFWNLLDGSRSGSVNPLMKRLAVGTKITGLQNGRARKDAL